MNVRLSIYTIRHNVTYISIAHCNDGTQESIRGTSW